MARLYICAEDSDFDAITIQHFKDEGFNVTYLPYNGNIKELSKQMQTVGDGLDLGERWGLIAYSAAATAALEICQKPVSKLSVLICYYPPKIPHTASPSPYPSSLNVQVHLASTQSNLQPKCKTFTYEASAPGFAEHDLDEYDKVSSRLAWTRTLGALREAFAITVDHEKVWDEHLALEFATRDAAATMKTMVSEPYVNHVPVMTGGIGHKDLYRFYRDFFIPGNPPSTRMRLLSRTVGVDRIVDELHVSFVHTCEIPWMLPSVPPTDKKVEIAIVSVVCIRGGKLYHEHIYWDQATVLLQLGLLDPTFVPKGFRSAEGVDPNWKVKRLPVCGAEAARKVVDEEDGESNVLIGDWLDGQEEEDDDEDGGEDAGVTSSGQ